MLKGKLALASISLCLCLAGEVFADSPRRVSEFVKDCQERALQPELLDMEYSLRFDNEKDARVAANLLGGEHFRFEVRRSPVTSEWLLRIFERTAPHETAIASNINRFQALAAKSNGRFGGYSCKYIARR